MLLFRIFCLLTTFVHLDARPRIVDLGNSMGRLRQSLEVIDGASDESRHQRLYGTSAVEDSAIQRADLLFKPYELTTNDSYLTNLPRFVLQPEPVVYVTDSRADRIECRAFNSNLVLMRCVDDDNRRRRFRRPSTRSSTSFVKRIVSSRDLVGWSSFWCRCEAWINRVNASRPAVVYSRKSRVKLAYIGDLFDVNPLSVRAELGSRVEFECRAPEGDPKPEINWLKDDQLVNRTAAYFDKSPNQSAQMSFIHSTKGHTSLLIIHATGEIDQGSVYQCRAENLAGTRLSSKARLTLRGREISPNTGNSTSDATNYTLKLSLGLIMLCCVIAVTATLCIFLPSSTCQRFTNGTVSEQSLEPRVLPIQPETNSVVQNRSNMDLSPKTIKFNTSDC